MAPEFLSTTLAAEYLAERGIHVSAARLKPFLAANGVAPLPGHSRPYYWRVAELKRLSAPNDPAAPCPVTTHAESTSSKFPGGGTSGGTIQPPSGPGHSQSALATVERLKQRGRKNGTSCTVLKRRAKGC